MQAITTAQKFDDRAVDFLTGRKVSPPMECRKVCECCGQRIVKGFITNLGPIGEDCREVIRAAGRVQTFADYEAGQRRIGWGVKPVIARFLKSQVYQ